MNLSVGSVVGEVSCLRSRRQSVGAERGTARDRRHLEVRKEEQFVSQVRYPGRQLAAEISAEVLSARLRDGLPAHVLEEVVVVEVFVLELLEHFEVIRAGAPLGGEADLHRAFTRRFRAAAARGYGNL